MIIETIRNMYFDAPHVFAEEVESLLVKLDCVMLQRTPVYQEVGGYSSTRLTEIQFATVQSERIHFLEKKQLRHSFHSRFRLSIY